MDLNPLTFDAYGVCEDRAEFVLRGVGTQIAHLLRNSAIESSESGAIEALREISSVMANSLRRVMLEEVCAPLHAHVRA